MSKTEHHKLCLGVLANLYRKAKHTDMETWLDANDLAAIDQAVESAEKELKMKVSVERLRQGLPIATDQP